MRNVDTIEPRVDSGMGATGRMGATGGLSASAARARADELPVAPSRCTINPAFNERRPWLLVSGDFTRWGGMDRPNYELAWYLANELDLPVWLVSHFVAQPLSHHENVTWHRVPRPLDCHWLAAPLLAFWAGRLMRRLAPHGARVVANGGCYRSPDVNWVHAVHAAWDNRSSQAGAAFRLRAAATKRVARRLERRAVRAAGTVIANSDRARGQMVDKLRIPEARVHRVYYGIDPQAFRPVAAQEKASARRRLGWPEDRLVVAFIGALGHDRNKGFDVLFDAWRLLLRDAAWDADLVAAGGGAEVNLWRDRARAAGLGRRVRMLGFTKQIPDVLAASDALVSPTHYDAYGQGVHEAICSGVPAFVTRTAGVAERFPRALEDLLLESPPSARDIAGRLRRWRTDATGFARRVGAFASCLRERTWSHMAAEIVDLVERTPAKQGRRAA
jgi:glycosyltransferase involved in cell wall biosynthesis